MGADFEDVFAGIRMRSAEESNHDLVDFFAATIEPPSNDGFPMIEFRRTGMRLKESAANGKHLRSRHSEDSKSAMPQRSRDRNDRILAGNDLVQAFLHCQVPCCSLGRACARSLASVCGDQYLLMKICCPRPMMLPVNQ